MDLQPVINRMVQQIGGPTRLTPTAVTAWLRQQPYQEAIEMVDAIRQIDSRELQQMVDAVEETIR